MKRQMKGTLYFVSGFLATAAGALELLWTSPALPRSWDVHESDRHTLLKTLLAASVVLSVFFAANVLAKHGFARSTRATHKAELYHLYSCEFSASCILVLVNLDTEAVSTGKLLYLFGAGLSLLGYFLPLLHSTNVSKDPANSAQSEGTSAENQRLESDGVEEREGDEQQPLMGGGDSESTAVESTGSISWLLVIFTLVITLCGIGLGVGYALFRQREPYSSCFAGLSDASPLTSEIADETGFVRYSIGSFLFAYNTANKQIVLSHKSNAEKAIFYTNPGETFVAVGLGKFSAVNANSHDGGAFTITDTVDMVSNGNHLLAISQVDSDTVLLNGNVLFANNASIPYTMTFSAVEGSDSRISYRVQLDAEATESVAPSTDVRIYVTQASDATEHFFGFGSTPLDTKGGCVPILTSEQGVGRGLQPLSFFLNLKVPNAAGSWQTTYTAIPHYITSKLRSMFLENTEFTVFDLRHPDRVTVEVVTTTHSAAGQLVSGKSPQALIAGYTEWAGRMRPLPAWTSRGAIVGLQGGTALVKKKLQALREAEVPISALWLQDWTGKVETGFGRRLLWDWKLNLDHYPGWHEWLAELAQEGIYVMTYINPYVISWGSMFPEARARGCLVSRPDGSVYVQASATADFTFGTVDLTDPACFDWYVAVMRRNMLNATAEAAPDRPPGAIGWMADFGEMLPMDAVLRGGDARVVHNEFPTLWSEACRRAIAVNEAYEREAVFFMRAGGARQPRFNTLQWLGDQLVTFDKFDGLASALSTHLTLGLSGYSFIHSDIGGYTMIKRFPFEFFRSRELICRWMEMNAFLDSVFRTHEGNMPDHSVQVYDDPEIAAVFARFSNIHVALGAYRQGLMQDVTEYGMPLARSLFLHYPQDENVYSLSTQFLLGPDVLVCPVLQPNTVEVACYIPADSGTWRQLWTDETVSASSSGDWVTCPAPLGKPCVWYRSDSTSLNSFRAKLGELGYLDEELDTATRASKEANSEQSSTSESCGADM